MISAPVVSYVPSGGGAWLVEVQAVLKKIQASTEEIRGPCKYQMLISCF